jgi:hypothetical protein
MDDVGDADADDYDDGNSSPAELDGRELVDFTSQVSVTSSLIQGWIGLPQPKLAAIRMKALGL